jgi:hypothetical protein
MGVGLGFVAAQPFAQLMAQQEVEGAAAADEEAKEQTSASEGSSSTNSSSVVHVWCRNQSGLAYRAAQVQLLAQTH